MGPEAANRVFDQLLIDGGTVSDMEAVTVAVKAIPHFAQCGDPRCLFTHIVTLAVSLVNERRAHGACESERACLETQLLDSMMDSDEHQLDLIQLLRGGE